MMINVISSGKPSVSLEYSLLLPGRKVLSYSEIDHG